MDSTLLPLRHQDPNMGQGTSALCLGGEMMRAADSLLFRQPFKKEPIHRAGESFNARIDNGLFDSVFP